MSEEADLFNMTEISRRIGVSTNTLRVWERRGLITARGKGRGRLFHLPEVQDAQAPAGYLPSVIAAARIGVPSHILNAWEASRRIPAYLRPTERKAFVLESDITRILAWFMWGRAPKRAAEYPAVWDPYPAQKDIWGFERAIAEGKIPERFSAAHYRSDESGWRFDPFAHLEP